MASPLVSPIAAPARFPRIILATCPVPWRQGAFDEGLFRRVARWAATDLSPHLYIFGTAGEGYAVTDRQFETITRAFVDEMHVAGGVPMVGVISLSIGTILERLDFAYGLGVRRFQVSLPAWGALDDPELEAFFDATCGRFPTAHFLHYNLGRAKRVLTGADYVRLAARHANLVAIKMGGENLTALREVATAVPALRCFFTEFGYLTLRDATDCGLLCALGICAPALARRLFAADASERAALEPVFRTLHAAAKSALGGHPRMDGAYDKMFLKRNFPEFPLELLPPYTGASALEFAHFMDACAPILGLLPASAAS